MGVAPQRMQALGKIGRYEILGRLALGGMAEIFLARETGPHAATRTLVVKRVLQHIATEQRVVSMFVQEASLCMRLRHPSICPIYEFGEEGGTAYLAMEWVDGVSLRQLIDRAKKRKTDVPFPIVAYVLSQVAGALHHAHSATGENGDALDIVHRDVTPENVMISFDGQVKLLDFGVAKAQTQSSTTQHGELKGKFAYMSPEQYRGDKLDGRSDLFSLGAVAYEALTSKALFLRSSEFETVAAIVLDSKVPTPRAVRPDLPDALETIVLKALERDRDHRYPNAEMMEGDLDQYLAKSGEIVRASTLKTLLADLFAPEIARGPKLDTSVRLESTGSRSRPEDADEITGRLDLEAELDATEHAMITSRKRKRAAVIALGATIVFAMVAAVVVQAIEGAPPARDESSLVDPR